MSVDGYCALSYSVFVASIFQAHGNGSLESLVFYTQNSAPISYQSEEVFHLLLIIPIVRRAQAQLIGPANFPPVLELLIAAVPRYAPFLAQMRVDTSA
jgi:hypothetical protein